MGRKRRRLFSPKNQDLPCNRFYKGKVTTETIEEPPTVTPVVLKHEPVVEEVKPVVKEVTIEKPTTTRKRKPATTRKRKPTTTRKRRTTKTTLKKEKSLTTKED